MCSVLCVYITGNVFIYCTLLDVPVNDSQKEREHKRFEDKGVRSDTLYDHCVSDWLRVHYVRTTCIVLFVFWPYSI